MTESEMLDWLEPRLHEKLRERHNEKLAGIVAKRQKKLTPLERALVAANKGEVGPLRRILVELTGNKEVERFINLPKLPKGQNWNRAEKKREQPPEIAEWAAIIREIWKEHRVKHRGGWSAEECAFSLYMKDAGIEGWYQREPFPETDDKRWSDRAAKRK